MDAKVVLHWVAGTGAAPAATAPQVPLEPVPLRAAEHAMQVPVHATLQQNPFAQNPVVHWSIAEHAAPCVPLATQVPLAPGLLQ